MKCRICGSNSYQSILDLGMIHPSGFSQEGAVLPKSPLHLVRCVSCSLVQLEQSVDLDLMYKNYYWFRSALNPAIVAALKNIVLSAMARLNLKEGDVVCDIGANDLTLLNFYPNQVIKVAYEPASNLAPYGKSADYYINNYFFAASWPLIQKAKIVTTVAMLYDLENPRAFINDVAQILAEDGIWIAQYTDLYETIKNNDFMNICQEHLCYYSTDLLIKILAEAGLEIFDMERNDTNGGSVRLYIRHIRHDPKPASYYRLLGEELDFLASQDFDFSHFRQTVQRIKTKLRNFLLTYGNVYALAASTKSATLIQYCNLDMIKAIGEVNQDKIGKKNVTGIPIVHEDDILDINPPLILVLTWQFRSLFLNKLQSYIYNGGTVVFPLPKPHFINHDGIWWI